MTRQSSQHDPKPCVACGREITWRKKWERDWDNVKFCSDACRSRKGSAVDVALEEAILSLLAKRAAGATICPSDAAKLVAVGSQSTKDQLTQHRLPQGTWETLMEPARSAARRLVARGEIIITQQGHEVDPSRAKGPIRLRKK